MFYAAKTINSTVCNVSLNLKLCTIVGNSCNVIPCDVKYDGDYISGLTFV
jgi:hypothetical protein